MLSLLCPCQIGLAEMAYLPLCDDRVLAFYDYSCRSAYEQYSGRNKLRDRGYEAAY